MNGLTIETNQPQANRMKPTYALLAASEEKKRNICELMIYPLLSLGTAIAIWQFAQQPVNFPSPAYRSESARIVCVGHSQTTKCGQRPG